MREDPLARGNRSPALWSPPRAPPVTLPVVTGASEPPSHATNPVSTDHGLFETWASDDFGEVRGGRPAVSKLGRYELREGIGAGGMGEVYRAYDPELDREVAIKRLGLGERSSDARLRLLREGQTIARLSHPHVVQVHDVGTEPQTGDLFIAMELIEGTTLRAWLRRDEPSWQAIAQVFAQAGEGLAAAHARGIVHRDFKPENVLVTHDGVAKVVDFGLAKPWSAPEPGGPAASTSHPQSADDVELRISGASLHSHLTPEGARLGTPAYMPPEQYAGESSDPRIDQFGFAVALYEAWVGHLPFEGSSPTEYAMAVLEGAVRPFPRDCPVPRRLQRAVLRAMSVKPGDRFETMAPLLEELRREPGRRRRRAGVVVTALALGGASSLVIGELVRDDADAGSVCTSVADAAGRVWSRGRRQQLVEALASVSSPLAEDTASRVAHAIDGWAQTWTDARRDVCLADATSVTDAPLSGLRRLCLERNLARQRSLVEALEKATPGMLEHATHAVEHIAADLERCSMPAYLEQIATEEAMPATEREEAVRGLARARQQLDLAELDEASQLLESMADEDVRTRWPAALILEWTELRGRIEGKRGNPHRFRELLEEGALLGLGGSAPIAAAQWHLAHGDALYEIDAVERADRAYARAEALFEHRYGGDAIETVLARATRGHLPFARGRYREALEIYAEAAAAAAVLAPRTDYRRLLVDGWVAETLAAAGQFEEATALVSSIIERHEQSRGPRHPMVIDSREQLGIVQLRSGDAQAALTTFEGTLALFDEALASEQALERATILANMGAAHTALHRHEEAARTLEGALAIFLEAGLEPEHTRVLAIRANLAESLSRQGKRSEAIALLQEILAHMQRSGIESTNNGLMVQLNLATALLEEGRADEAVPVLERALSSEGRDKAAAGALYGRLAEALEASGRTGEAADARRARALLALHDSPER